MKIDCIYISCYKHDVRFTRILVASIRSWYKDIPIILIKDYRYGAFDTSDLERFYHVSIFETEKRCFGWGFGKLEPLFAAERKRCLILDSDIVMIGPVLDMLEQFSEDFVVTLEQPDREFIRRLYFDVDALEAMDPEFSFAGKTFNTGQLVATSGVLSRSDFDPFVDWSEPPAVKKPDIFQCGEQGLLNYILLKKLSLSQLSLKQTPIMIVADSPVCREMTMVPREAQKAHCTLIHWCGLLRTPLSPLFEGMQSREILLHFEAMYYQRLPLGPVVRWLRLLDSAARGAVIPRLKKIPNIQHAWNRLRSK